MEHTDDFGQLKVDPQKLTYIVKPFVGPWIVPEPNSPYLAT